MTTTSPSTKPHGRNPMWHHILLALILGGPLSYLFLSFYNATLCPLVHCLQPILTCVRDPLCQPLLECFSECTQDESERRQVLASRYKHLQFPHDPAVCQYDCMDTYMRTKTADAVIYCVAGSGCLPPAEYSDACALVPPDKILPFEILVADLEGKWTKLYTDSWDVWPCQETEFAAPGQSTPRPEAWMRDWPSNPKVWRMDLHWTVPFSKQDSQTPYTFHMSNEIHPNEQWEFAQESTHTPVATLKTRAVMWGTEATENWYLLHYDGEEKIMLVHVCAFTPDLNTRDAITLVLRKEGQPPLSDESRKNIERRAHDILGDKFGSLVRIPNCTLPRL